MATEGLNKEPALNRIDESYKSAVNLLETNKNQHKEITDSPKSPELLMEISSIYENTLDKLVEIRNTANEKIAQLDANPDKTISKKDFNKQVKKIKNETVNELGKALANYNVALISKTIETQKFSHTEKTELLGMVKDLSTNTPKGKVLRFAAGLFERPWVRKFFIKDESETTILVKKGTIGEKIELANRVVKAFDRTVTDFSDVAQTNFEERLKAHNDAKLKTRTGTTHLQASVSLRINNDRAEALARHSDVVGTDAIYTVGQVFTAKQGAKQIKSLISQQANLKERKIIDNEFVVTGGITGGNTTLNSQLIPLNRQFDQNISEQLGLKKDAVSKFAGIFGDAGTSSANREVEHVINGYLNKLAVVEAKGSGAEIQTEARRVHQVLRHAVNAYRFETNPEERERVAIQMTKELMLASFLISVADSGQSLEDLAKSTSLDNPWKQSVVSMSLVTPDMFRGLIEDVKNLGKKEKVHSSEEKMWRSQFNALQHFHNKPESISVGGQNIFVEYNVSSFNTGVNAGANKYGLGTLEQWWKARESVKNLNNLTDSVARRLEQNSSEKPSEFDVEQLKEIKSLQKDINRLTRTPFSYLGNGNQYELASKIQILTNRLADVIALYPKDVPPAKGSKKENDHIKVDGIVAWANCMSAKDRTGIEVACAFTFEQMRNELGHYPTTQEMKKSENQERFVQIYIQMLKEYGGEEVTEINTGARGYKVTEDAMLYPNAKAWKDYSLADIQQLSGTAGA